MTSSTFSRVEAFGRADLARQERSLRRCQCLSADTEEALGRRREAVRALAEVHLVEVTLQQLVLRVALFQFGGVQNLAEFAQERLLTGGVVQLRQLLGDRAPTLEVAARRPDQRPDHGAGVHAAVIVEILVLRREHGTAHVLRQRLDLHDGPPFFTADVAYD